MNMIQKLGLLIVLAVLGTGCASTGAKFREGMADVRDKTSQLGGKIGNTVNAVMGKEWVTPWGPTLDGAEVVLEREADGKYWYCQGGLEYGFEGERKLISSKPFKDGSCVRGEEVTFVAKSDDGFRIKRGDGTTWQCQVQNELERKLLASYGIGASRHDTVRPGTIERECKKVTELTGAVTGKVTGALYTQPIAGKQYVREFALQVAEQQVTCPVNTEQEKIAKPKGHATFFGDMTRQGCYSLN